MQTVIPSVGGATRHMLDNLLRQLTGHAIEIDNLRGEYRHPVHGPVTLGVRQGADGEFRALYRAWALDISRVGVSMLVENQLPVGINMHVNLQSLVGNRCIIPVQIVYTRQLLPNAHRLGATFILDEEPSLRLTD